MLIHFKIYFCLCFLADMTVIFDFILTSIIVDAVFSVFSAAVEILHSQLCMMHVFIKLMYQSLTKIK